MFSKYFGNFLLNKGIISSDQLKEIFQAEKNSHVKLGILALNKGFMTVEQIEEVNQIQMTTDKRFGEIAVERGYLTVDKLEELLTGQKTSYLLLSQILLDKNILTLEQISRFLFHYKNENGLTNEELQELTNDNVEKIIANTLKVKDDNLKEYVVLLAKNIERHLKEKAYVEYVKDVSIELPYIVGQEITGDYDLHTYLMVNESGFLKIASIFAEEELTEIDELAKSSVLEFLNLHNGIFIVNEVEKGYDLELKVQSMVEKLDHNDRHTYFMFTFADIELVLAVKKQ